MFQIFSGAATYLFPGGRALKSVKGGVNITNSTNPLILTKNITLTVVDCCAPPPVRLAFHCAGIVVTIGASIAAPKPVTIGSAIHLATEIYENC
jgi:hypothetical protein